MVLMFCLICARQECWHDKKKRGRGEGTARKIILSGGKERSLPLSDLKSGNCSRKAGRLRWVSIHCCFGNVIIWCHYIPVNVTVSFKLLCLVQARFGVWKSLKMIALTNFSRNCDIIGVPHTSALHNQRGYNAKMLGMPNWWCSSKWWNGELANVSIC